MKTLLKVIAGIVVLLIIAVVGFVYTFDANDYRKEITKLAEDFTGRSINIAGNMDISLYPWIGIKINDVTIDNPSGFSKTTFASIGQFDVRIKIAPLFLKRLDIEKLVLHRLTADFEKNAAGQSNWSDVADGSGGNNMESEFGLAGLAVGGIELADSNLTWMDAATGKQFKVSSMSISTEAITEGQPLPVKFNAFVESNQPEWQASVNAKSALEFDSGSPVFNANDLKLVVKALFPSSNVDKVSFAMAADSEIDLQSQSARLTNTRLSLLGLLVSGNFDVENIFSVPVIKGPLKVKTFEAATLAENLKIDMPQMAGEQSLKNISLSTSFRTDFDTIDMYDIVAKVDDSNVKGFVHIEDMSNPIVRYDLKVDKLSLGDYRTVDEEANKDAIPLPLDFIRVADLEGKLNVGSIMADDVEMTKFRATSHIKNGIVKANPITMLVGESEVKAAIQLDARKTPAGMVVVKVNNVDADSSINPILKAILGNGDLTVEGIVNADARLKLKGESLTELKNTATGTIKLTMDKPVVKGVDFDYVSRKAVMDYAVRNDFRTSRTFKADLRSDHKTEFKSLNTTFKVSKGKLVNDDLLLESDEVTVTGTGSIDYINDKLDYRPRIDMVVKNTVNVRDKLRDHPMEYHALGPFENVMCELDTEKYDLWVGRLMVQEAKARRNRRINEKSKNSWSNVRSK